MVLDHHMLSDSSYSGGPNGPPNFSFAFNDSNFSDRILRVEIIPGLHGLRSEGDGSNNIADWMRDRKRRREDINKKHDVEMNHTLADFAEDREVDIMFSRDEEAIPMVEESPVAVRMISTSAVDDSITGQGVCSWSMDCYGVLRVRTIHVSSAILAAKSPFFYKLFSNGMRESEQRDVTLRISSSEEEAFMDLLNFMYSGRINACTTTALLDVLMVADKFEVASCMHHCCSVLQNPSMTPESALLYLDLPSTVLTADAVQPLTDAARQFLAQRFRDMTKFQEDIMNLPLVGIEAVLSSDELQVSSEDVVFDFVIKWARQHYPKLEERKEILVHRLGHLIRFPNMSSRKLRKVLTCNDLDHDYASKVVLEALLFKDETPHRQKIMASEGNFHTRFCERAYKYRPVKVVEFDTPYQQCVVFMDLKKDECLALFPSGRLYSHGFNLGGQAFFLSAHCNMDQQTAFYCFGLYLGMQEKSAVGSTVEYEFATRSKPSCDFSVKYKGNYKFTGGKAVGYRNLFGIPWSAFMADDSPYFIHNILHLRAELTLKP